MIKIHLQENYTFKALKIKKKVKGVTCTTVVKLTVTVDVSNRNRVTNRDYINCLKIK